MFKMLSFIGINVVLEYLYLTYLRILRMFKLNRDIRFNNYKLESNVIFGL